MFSKLYINHKVIDYFFTKKIFLKLKIPFEVIYDQSFFFQKINNSKNSIDLGKRILYLTKNKGNYIKKCPGTPYYTCCGYYVLNFGSFCTMDCSYCILQTYLRPPITQFFVNFYKLEKELNKLFNTNLNLRIGTGEFTDSLLWEDLTNISNLLIKKFSLQTKCILELKTKTINIKNFKNLKHNRKTILSWSINTPKIIESEEKSTAPLISRLKAASICESWGYPLGFHFDPIFIYKNCKEDYKKVIELLFKSISSNNIVWISIGSFRFIPSLKYIIQKRFPLSKIIYNEFVKGLDGKIRYLKSLKINLYSHIVKCIRNIDPNVCIYFCMEDSDIWNQIMGINFNNKYTLNDKLNASVIEKCHINSI